MKEGIEKINILLDCERSEKKLDIRNIFFERGGGYNEVLNLNYDGLVVSKKEGKRIKVL